MMNTSAGRTETIPNQQVWKSVRLKWGRTWTTRTLLNQEKTKARNFSQTSMMIDPSAWWIWWNTKSTGIRRRQGNQPVWPRGLRHLRGRGAEVIGQTQRKAGFLWSMRRCVNTFSSNNRVTVSVEKTCCSSPLQIYNIRMKLNQRLCEMTSYGGLKAEM